MTTPSKPTGELRKYDLVDKYSYEADAYHAPYETIESETPGKARYAYTKLHDWSEYTDVLCRISRKGSFDLFHD